jgi:hypothetical protein
MQSIKQNQMTEMIELAHVIQKTETPWAVLSCCKPDW